MGSGIIPIARLTGRGKTPRVAAGRMSEWARRYAHWPSRVKGPLSGRGSTDRHEPNQSKAISTRGECDEVNIRAGQGNPEPIPM
jgi:hypothetical protein